MHSASQLPDERLLIGQLRAPFGLNGWLWVYSNTDPIQNIFEYLPWYVDSKQGWLQVSVKRWKPQGKGLIVSLKDVADRTTAETLVGADIWIAKAQLPKTGLDEYYWSDLKGLTVFGIDEHGATIHLGKIHELFETGANDVMVVRATADSIDTEERLIPWHRDVIRDIDIAQGTIHVNWGADY